MHAHTLTHTRPQCPTHTHTNTQLQSIVIPIGLNWWGSFDYNDIVKRVFDQAQRYNLARLQFHPALLTSKIFSSSGVVNDPGITEVYH